jgi:signal transduction histidine kinase
MIGRLPRQTRLPLPSAAALDTALDTAPAPPPPAAWRPSPATTRALLVAALIASAQTLIWAASQMNPGGLAFGLPYLARASWIWTHEFVAVMAMAGLAHHGLRWLPAGRWARRAGLVLLALLTWGVYVALKIGALALAIQGTPFGPDFDPAYLPAWLGPPLMVAAMLVMLEQLSARREAALQALHEAELRNLDLGREMAAAEYSLLQAQIEPHFLFNTLANLRRLLRTDRPAAQGLLGALLRYLEETLPRLRGAEPSTLRREAELARAYLEMHQVRMGQRLVWHVDVPAALEAVPVPPLLLLTLVENAIKHGLGPTVGGGRIDVRARRDTVTGRIDIEVADTGVGMGNAIGHGTGLANLRARLRALHGDAARLELRLNEPQGVLAWVGLPGGGA